MLKFAVATALLSIFIFGFHDPAAANVTATLSTQQPSYSGPCPVTITFTGSINGTKGTTFTYTWDRYINGVKQLVNGATVTLTSASQTVGDSITISSNASGNTFDEIWVHGISTGQPDVYSNQVYFTVTCVAPPTPTPSPSPSPSIKFNSAMVQAFVQPPDSVKQTSNEQECGSHGFGFGCPIAMSNGWLVLVWCWKPAGCGPASTSQNLKSFNVYEVDGGKHVLVDSVNADSGGNVASAGAVQTPNGGFANQCYAVVAVMSNNNSSVASNAVCLGTGTVGSLDTTYHSTESMIQGQSKAYNQNTFPFSSGECAPGPLCVGWYDDQSSIVAPNVIPIWWYADNFRTYYLFDLSSIAGHYVASATLRVPVSGGNASCASAYAAANAAWDPNTSFSAWIGGDFSPVGGSVGDPIDVTSIVRSWVSGSPNYGFVIRGRNENLDGQASKCITMLGSDATLEIVHS